MPVLVTCYKCGRKLRIHDHLIGRKTRCPVCKSVFMTEGNAPDPPAPAEWEIQVAPEREIQVAPFGSAPPVRRLPPASADEEILEGVLHETEESPEPEYPRPVRPLRRKPVHRSSLENVRIGLTLKLLAAAVRVLIAILLISIIVPVGVAGVRSHKERPLNPDDVVAAAAGAGIILILLMLTAEGLALAGYAFCLAAPEKHGAKTLAIFVLSLGVLAFVPACVGFIIPFANLVGGLIGLVEAFLFLFFLRALARCLDSRDLEDRASTAIRLLATSIGWFITIPVIAFLLAATGLIDPKEQVGYLTAMCLLGGFTCIGLIIWLAYLVWYIWSLAEARYEIGYYLDRHY